MIRPDDEDKPFVSRWNTLVRILLVESSVKLVARTAMDYANFHDGAKCHPSNERLARDTGLSKRTVITAWAAMRGLGMAERVAHGIPHKGLADEYQLAIPGDWMHLPILGPKGGRFACLHCGESINPVGNCTVGKDGRMLYDVRPYVFCPKPRAKKGRDESWCYDDYNRVRDESGKPTWTNLENAEAWGLFRKSRNDDW